jgi:hypothetical protein
VARRDLRCALVDHGDGESPRGGLLAEARGRVNGNRQDLQTGLTERRGDLAEKDEAIEGSGKAKQTPWVSTAPRIGGARLAIQPFSVTTVACRPRSSRLVAATARPLQRAPWSHCRARGSTEAPPAASAARHAGAPTTPAKARIPNSPMPLPR